MGLETDITDIQSLNQNWPPVSDPRAQGADHIRNIKKAIQLTFPNLKQCLLNDAQFTALGTLIGDGSGTLTVNGSLLVPSVSDWTTQQAVGAKDADKRYLQLSTTNTQTVSGPVTFSGKTLVPNVDDFTSQEAIPAAQADSRYIRSPANPNTDARIITISRNKASGGIFAAADDGSNTQLQPAGDYATNTALNTETTNRTNADTNLQNQIDNRVLKTGDTSSGSQFTRNKYDNGTLHWGPSWTSIIAGMGAGSSNGEFSFSLWAQTLDGTYTGGILSINGFYGRKDFRFNEDGNVFTPLGTVALTSQLPFTDQNIRVQVFSAIASDATFVRIPQAFKTLVGVTAQQHSSGGEGIRPIRIETNVFRGDGFNVSIWSGGGNIQYTFVAYGYF